VDQDHVLHRSLLAIGNILTGDVEAGATASTYLQEVPGGGAGERRRQMGEQSGINISRVRTIGVPVTDQERALKFYLGTLGFTTRIDVTLGAGLRWIEVAPHESDGTSLALLHATKEAPSGVETGIRLMTQDADAADAAMRSRGVDVDEVLRWPDAPPMFAFRDQDGNGLEIVEGE
jgi:lactoylglutathione lyase